MEKTYRWRGWDDPTLLNRADVSWHGDRLSATGTQQHRDYRAEWALQTTAGWVTSRLAVEVTAATWGRSLVLERDPATGWRATVDSWGTPPPGLAEPGIVDPAALHLAVDCDLGLCPLTNTMPIRRLGLATQPAPRTALVMAWVEMPSLRVTASSQGYASPEPGMVCYDTGPNGVHVLLPVDGDGVVLDYPDLAHRVPD